MSSVVSLLLASISLSTTPSPAPTDSVSKIVGEYGVPPAFTQVVLVIVILGALVVILKNAKDLLESLEKLQSYGQKIVTFLQGDPAGQSAKIRVKFLKRLRQDVDRRISDSLLNQIWMDVQKQDYPEAILDSRLREPGIKPTTPQRTNILSQVGRIFMGRGQPTENLKASQPISEIFDRSSSRLLILGEPGAGKTTELLNLAKQLIAKAEDDLTQPIPVIFELSAWKDDLQPIEEWLVAQLKEVYDVPTAVGQNWLQNNQLIPLLDGLDELAVRREDEVDRTRQILCVHQINEFASSHSKQKLTVCCRQKDYDEGFEQGIVRLDKFNGAIQLQPLKDIQIEKYFNDLNRPHIWEHIRQQPELKKLAKFPLFLNIIVLASQNGQITNLTELFDAYIREQLSKRPGLKKYQTRQLSYSQSEILHYLVILAKELKAESKTEFLIEKMQPRWLKSRLQGWFYKVISNLVTGLFSLPIFLLAFYLYPPTNSLKDFIKKPDLVFLLVAIWLLLFTFLGLFFATVEFLLKDLQRSSIKPMDDLHFSFSNAKLAEFIPNLFLGLGLGLISAIAFKFDYMIIMGCLIGLTVGFVSAFKTQIALKSQPNRGIWNSAKISILTSMTVFMACLFSNELFGYGFNQELKPGLEHLRYVTVFIPTVLVFLINGGNACVEHISLRFVLWNWGKGAIPWNYAKFLDYAHDLRFVQRINGRYRFVHDLLREHFASMEE